MADLKGGTTIGGNIAWHSGNMGAGSGLDADLLDNMQPSASNTVSTIVARDASGNFSAGTITATNLTSSGALSITSATTNVLTIDSGTSGGINIGTNSNAKFIGIGNFTGSTEVSLSAGSGGIYMSTANSGGVTLLSNGIGVVFIDSAGTGEIDIGTNSNAKTIKIGNTTGATNVVVNSGTSGVTFNQVAAGIFKVQASAAPTTDMVQITNVGQAVTTANVNALSITFVGGAAAIETSAVKLDITPGTTAAGTWNGYRVTPTAAAATSVTMNGLKFDNITAGSGTDNMLYAGTGWDNIINYNGTSIINGSGQINASQLLTGTIPGARGTAAGGAASSFIPYNGNTTPATGQFDSSSTNPSSTARLNYNGYLYGTKLYSGGTEVSVNGHTHTYTTQPNSDSSTNVATTQFVKNVVSYAKYNTIGIAEIWLE